MLRIEVQEMKRKEEEPDCKSQIPNKKVFLMNNKPQIFLLHFAGGSCYSFEFLRKYLNKNFDFIALELPGRGRRYDENILFNKFQCIEDYTDQIKKLRNNSPYVIYGHSMGATLGLGVVKKMEDYNDPPLHLIVTGNAGPNIKELDKEGKPLVRHLMDDHKFKEELRRLGGVPEDILENEDLYNFFSPIIRADFEVLEKKDFYKVNYVIKTPIYAIMGTKEKRNQYIKNWNNYTANQFQFQILEGDHFFINNHPELLVKVLEECFINNVVTN